MKILLSFLQDTSQQPHPIPAYRFWTYYIKNGIEEAGMQWTEIPGLDWAAGLVPYENDPELDTWKALAWDKTLAHIKANRQHIDIFLCYLYPKQINVQAIQQIRQLGIPCVNFYCDNIRSFKKLPAEFKVFDLVWVPEYEAVNLYKNAGVAYLNLPMPMWVEPKYRSLPRQENKNILFIGSRDELRAEILHDVIARQIPVLVRGNGWQNQDRQQPLPSSASVTSLIKNQLNLIRNSGAQAFIAYHVNRYKKRGAVHVPQSNILEKPGFEEYIDLTRESSIILGINRVEIYNRINQNILTYSRLRDIEAPMLGACYLTELTQGLPHLYELGREIETYSSAQELADKCRELINSKTKRMELRMLGQQRALNDHSIPKSLQKIKTRLFS